MTTLAQNNGHPTPDMNPIDYGLWVYITIDSFLLTPTDFAENRRLIYLSAITQ